MWHWQVHQLHGNTFSRTMLVIWSWPANISAWAYWYLSNFTTWHQLSSKDCSNSRLYCTETAQNSKTSFSSHSKGHSDSEYAKWFYLVDFHLSPKQKLLITRMSWQVRQMVAIPLKPYFKLKLIWERPSNKWENVYRIWIVLYLLKKGKKKKN